MRKFCKLLALCTYSIIRMATAFVIVLCPSSFFFRTCSLPWSTLFVFTWVCFFCFPFLSRSFSSSSRFPPCPATLTFRGRTYMYLEPPFFSRLRHYGSKRLCTCWMLSLNLTTYNLRLYVLTERWSLCYSVGLGFSVQETRCSTQLEYRCTDVGSLFRMQVGSRVHG